MYLFDSEDAIKMEILIGIIKRGFYLNAKDVSDLYNKIFNKNVNPTTCASCTRQRYEELLRAYKIFTNNEVTEEQCAKNMSDNVRRMFPKDIACYKENKAINEEKERIRLAKEEEKRKRLEREEKKKLAVKKANEKWVKNNQDKISNKNVRGKKEGS